MGGMETHLRDLVVHQSALTTVNVIVAGDSPKTTIETIDGATVTRIATLGTIASVPVCPVLGRALRGRTDALVHMHLPNPGAAAAFLMSGHPGKLIVTHHSDTLGRRFLRRLSDPFVNRVMERASAIVVTSKRYLENSDELEPFREKCHIIPMGIDPARFEAEMHDEAEPIRLEYGNRLVLAVGRLVPYKGFEFLIRSMSNVDARLLIIGTGPLFAKLQELIKSCGLSEKVSLVGHVKDIAPYYKAASLFVLPSISRAEAFGIVQLEAMASGLPVVNTDINSGVPEVSIDGETGITVTPRNAGKLADAINLLLGNPELKQKYGLAGVDRVRREFSVQGMAERTLRIYEDSMPATEEFAERSPGGPSREAVPLTRFS
jgi:glycosyltransferase involved in cell wall biosynthesis